MSWSVASTVTGPEPVTVDEVKLFLRIPDDHQDAVLETLITAAREQQEEALGVAVVVQDVVVSGASFPTGRAVFRLPRTPVRSLVSIQYVDTSGATQTLHETGVTDGVALYQPGILFPLLDATWPSAQAGGVTITYEAGPLDDVAPARLRTALMMRVGDLYEHREAQGDARELAPNPTVDLLEMRTPVFS